MTSPRARRANQRNPPTPLSTTQADDNEIIPPSPEQIRRLLLTVADTAEALHVSQAKVWRLIGGKHPAIPSVMVIGSRRIRRSDLEQYVASLR